MREIRTKLESVLESVTKLREEFGSNGQDTAIPTAPATPVAPASGVPNPPQDEGSQALNLLQQIASLLQSLLNAEKDEEAAENPGGKSGDGSEMEPEKSPDGAPVNQ